MKEVMELLSRLIFNNLGSLAAPKGPTVLRLVANLTAFLLLVFGYVLGCRVLYHYIKPYWGEEISLLVICGVLLLTSFVLFIVSWLLKPKKSQSMNLIAAVEKTISEIPSQEILKKVTSMVSTKAVVSIFAVAVMASYFSNFNKKNI